MNEVMQRILADRRERIANERLASGRLRAERRERIATACLAGLLANPNESGGADDMTATAIRFADALIAKLEAKP